MNIKDLQKLDFFIKILNERNASENYKIIFGLNGNAYYGNFIPKVEMDFGTRKCKVCLRDFNNLASVEYDEIDMSDDKQWRKLSTHHSGGFDETILGELIKSSMKLPSYAYMMKIQDTMNKYPINTLESLPSYIYNVEGINNSVPFTFIKINENIQFDFVTIIPEDHL